MSDEFLHCPFCPQVEWVSPEDPDASFNVMLGHIRHYHADQDQHPRVLWPKIQLRSAA